jgi:hypothetical protein
MRPWNLCLSLGDLIYCFCAAVLTPLQPGMGKDLQACPGIKGIDVIAIAY